MKEAREAIEEVVDSDQALAAVCLRDEDGALEELDLTPRQHHRRRHHAQQASSQFSAVGPYHNLILKGVFECLESLV